MNTDKGYTQEPWHYSRLNGEAGVWANASVTGSMLVAKCGYAMFDEANARRIADCVNGCAGLADPHLTVPLLVEALEKVTSKLEAWREHHQSRCMRLPDSECEADRNTVVNYSALIEAARGALDRALP